MLEILGKQELINIYGNSADFKMFCHWMSDFMKRYKLSRQRHTKVSQKLPSQTNELLNNFQQYIIRFQTENSMKWLTF